MTIKWALTFNIISAAGYYYVRESLSHMPTLSTDMIIDENGKSCGVLTDNIDILKSRSKDNITDVPLMHDEMRIKDKLVYNPAGGNLIRFVELGETNTAL